MKLFCCGRRWKQVFKSVSKKEAEEAARNGGQFMTLSSSTPPPPSPQSGPDFGQKLMKPPIRYVNSNFK